MEIMNAKELENKVHNTEKEQKFEQMVEHQQKIIEECMKDGHKDVLWIFSDKDYFTTDCQRQWFEEFNHRAKTMFEDAGYKVCGIIIRW